MEWLFALALIVVWWRSRCRDWKSHDWTKWNDNFAGSIFQSCVCRKCGLKREREV